MSQVNCPRISIIFLPIAHINIKIVKLAYRVVIPPVNPVGGSDLFPGPGAGMYPTRYFFVPNQCFSSHHWLTGWF